MKKIINLILILMTTMGLMACLQDAPGELDGEDDNDKTVVDIRSGADLTNIDTESSFVFEFTKDIDTSTVTESTFFMTESSSSASISKIFKADSENNCNVENAIDATVTCESSSSCELDPANNLTEGTTYAICLTTEIRYDDGSAFEGFSITIETAGDPPVQTCNATSDCESENFCYYGVCKDAADFALSTTFECESSEDCAAEFNVSENSVACVPISLTDGSCTTTKGFCALFTNLFNTAAGYPSTQSTCEEESNHATWFEDEDKGDMCLPNDLAICILALESENENNDNDNNNDNISYYIGAIRTGPSNNYGGFLAYSAGNYDWSLTLNSGLSGFPDTYGCSDPIIRVDVNDAGICNGNLQYCLAMSWYGAPDAINLPVLSTVEDTPLDYLYVSLGSIISKLALLGVPSSSTTLIYFQLGQDDSLVGDSYPININYDSALCE